MSNRARLKRPARRAAARAVAAASVCGDCGARAGRPRKEAGSWVIDMPHERTCPARTLPGLRDSLGRAAVTEAQQATSLPLAYLPGGGGVVVAR